MSQGLRDVRQAVHFAAILHGKSRMRKRARTDLRGGRSAMVVPTATGTRWVPAVCDSPSLGTSRRNRENPAALRVQ